MNRTEHKGFTIETVSTDGLGTVSFRYFVIVPGTTKTRDGFNPEGYTTLSGAKGAITKHVNAQEAAQAKAEEVAATLPYPVESVPPATVMGMAGNVTVTAGDVVAAKATTPEEMTAIVANCDAIAIRAENEKTKSDTESDKIMAELRYHGFVKGVHGFTPKQPDSRSRNKREGRYAGKSCGKQCRKGKREYYPNTVFPSGDAAFHGIA